VLNRLKTMLRQRYYTFTSRLILFLFCACMVMGFSSSDALSQGVTNNWKKGDIIHSTVVCLSEETILEVARQDSRSLESTVSFLKGMIQIGRCISFMQPLPFRIDDIVLQYKDYNQSLSSVIRINHPYADNNPFGFLIALQKPSV